MSAKKQEEAHQAVPVALDLDEVVETRRFPVQESMPVNGTREMATAYHECVRPTAAQMEDYRKQNAKVRANKVEAQQWPGNNSLWGKCVRRLHNYGGRLADVPLAEAKKILRSNEVGKNHIDIVASQLVQWYSGDTEIDPDL